MGLQEVPMGHEDERNCIEDLLLIGGVEPHLGPPTVIPNYQTNDHLHWGILTWATNAA